MIPRVVLLYLMFAVFCLGQRIPRSVFKATDYEVAKAEALAEGKGLAVIFTYIDSTCPHTRFGTESAFKRMKSDYVLVLQDNSPGTETGKLDLAVRQEMFKVTKNKGNVVPLIAVLSPETDTFLGGVSYRQIKADERKWVRTMTEEVAQAQSGQSPADEGGEIEPDDDSDGTGRISSSEGFEESEGMQQWTDVRGRSMTAELLAANDLTATFKLENGNVIDLPLTKLSQESLKAVEDSR